MFSYNFQLDGTIDVSVRASGYFQGKNRRVDISIETSAHHYPKSLGQYYQGNEEYGYHVHDALSGSMHDHTLNFKADFDILGTANTAQLTSFVPANVKYKWSDAPRQTMKLQRDFVESEDNSRLIW